MTREEFICEVHAWEGAPEHFDQIYEDFQYYQKLAVETLQEVRRICTKEGVAYQLAYGSVLGAVRDHGQIPWDYDVDLFVAYEDKDKLLAALKKNLDSRFYYYCPEIDDRCRHKFVRVTPAGYRSEVLHVDIFYLTGTPEDAGERESFCREIARLADIRFGNRVNPFEEGVGHPRVIARLFRRKLRVLGKSVRDADRRFDELCRKYPAKTSSVCARADCFGDRVQHDGRLFRETVMIETESGEYPIPGIYHEILQKSYGDYTIIPPLESRIGELLVHYRRLKAFENKKCILNAIMIKFFSFTTGQ